MRTPILVPLDGSALAEQALPYAETLAGSACQLVLLEVWQDADDEFALRERHGDSCAQLETVSGDPAEQILQTAQQLGVGMIVMTTHGRGALGRLALGSVADEVSRKASVPVMMIHPASGERPDVAPAIKRFVVPLDGSALSEQALPAASALAERLQAPVHLLTVVGSTSAVTLELTLAAFDATQFQQSVDELFTAAEALLAGHAEGLQRAGLAVTWEVLRGSPYFAITGALRPGDVIVMASHRRYGLERWFLGSVAEKLIREGSVPVILVPAGDQPAAVSNVVPAGEAADLVSR